MSEKIFNSNYNNAYSRYRARIGNFFTLNDGVYDTVWIIAAISRYYTKSDVAIGENYIVIPRSYLKNVNPNKDYGASDVNAIIMNSTSTTGVSKNPLNPLYETTQGEEIEGYQGYYGSDMNQIFLPSYAVNLHNILGNHMIQFRLSMSSGVDLHASSTGASWWEGASISMSYSDIYLALMNEIEVYGANVFSSSGYDTGMGCSKYPLFNFVNNVHFGRNSCWLRSVASRSRFCCASGAGLASSYGAADPYRMVRPFMLIK